MEPSSTSVQVTGISPSTGSTFGGTAVTITGANFTQGATVMLGGIAATDVAVVNATTLTATTAPHAAGAADVAVTSGGRTGMLARAYTFVTPSVASNTPPVIIGIGVRGSLPREPAQFASLDEVVNVTAIVTDAEASPSQLTVGWSASAGAFSGAGTSVTWRAPATFSTPGAVILTLTVTERYTVPDASGLPVTREHVVQAASTVRLHDSIKEVGDMAVQFLVDFSRQIPPAQVMRNFSDQCSVERAAELADVERNQRDYTINTYSVGTAATTVGFTGRCPFRNVTGDACAQVAVEWRSTNKVTGAPETARGIDQVTAVYEDGQSRWRLCASDFNGTATPTAFRWLTP
jgi:hypothetical protein